MSDMNKRGPADCEDGEGEHGERGERGERGRRGHRGHRGRDGRDGRDGATGPTGPAGSGSGTGFTGPSGPAGTPGSTGATGAPGSTGATGPTGSSGSGGAPIIAAALVNGVPAGDGFVSQRGFSSYTRTSAGQYRLALAGTPPPDANCVVNVTLATALTNTVNVVAGVVGGVVTVLIYAGAPLPNSPVFQDARFNVIVTDDR